MTCPTKSTNTYPSTVITDGNILHLHDHMTYTAAANWYILSHQYLLCEGYTSGALWSVMRAVDVEECERREMSDQVYRLSPAACHY